MDINPDRLDWSHLRSFLATAETKSLSAAARKLGLTQPTLSRQIAALEEHLSLMLFERVGRGLVLTDAGQELLTHVRDMGAAAERAALTASAQRLDISGNVRITVGDIYAATFMPTIVADLMRRAPALTVTIVATNDISDLMRREADIAIRHVRPDQPDLVARLVREARGRFYAATSYLNARGRPGNRAALAAHDWVSFGDVDQNVRYMNAIDIPINAACYKTGSENGLVAWEMARAGLGICAMDERIGDDATGMEPVLRDDLWVDFPVWLVTHREVHTNPRIRLVFDVLADAVAAG